MNLTSFLDLLADNDYCLSMKGWKIASFFIDYPAYCFNSAYEVNIMAAITHEQHSDFHWTAANLSFAILLGVIATAALWLFAGLLITFLV